MRGQLERLVREIDLPSLTLGILPTTAEVDMVPTSGFNMYDGQLASYELVSTGVDITDPAELALHEKAFRLLSSAACYGDDARRLIEKALAFWSSEG